MLPSQKIVDPDIFDLFHSIIFWESTCLELELHT